MAKFWAVFKREYLERVRSKWFIIATLFGPIVFGGLYIIPVVIAARTKPTANVSDIIVLDATGAGLGRRVSQAMGGGLTGDTSLAEVRVVEPAALAAAESLATREVVARGGALGYLVLDAETLTGGSRRGLRARYAGRNASTLRDVARLERAVREAVLMQRLEGEGLDPDRIRALTNVRLNLDAERVTSKGRAGSGMASAGFGYAIAILLYMMIALFGQAVLRGVMEEKTTRVSEVIVSSAPTDTLLAGKVLGVGAVGLTQQLVWLLLTLAILQARKPLLARLGAGDVPVQLPSISPEALALLVLFFFLGFLFYAACFAAVGAMVNNQEDAQQASMPVILLLVSSVVFMTPVLLNPNSTTSRVVSIVPITAPILMPMRLTVTQVPWYEVLASVLAIALACALVIWLASRIYRVGLLMYGKRPTLRELGHWIRY